MTSKKLLSISIYDKSNLIDGVNLLKELETLVSGIIWSKIKRHKHEIFLEFELSTEEDEKAILNILMHRQYSFTHIKSDFK